MRFTARSLHQRVKLKEASEASIGLLAGNGIIKKSSVVSS
jgi:hypothetical protein